MVKHWAVWLLTVCCVLLIPCIAQTQPIVEVADWQRVSQEPTNSKLYYSEKLKTSKWVGYPDTNYSWDGEKLSYERTIKIDGNDVTVKTYKEPYEIIARIKPESSILSASNEIEIAVAKRFGSIKGFVWLDKVSGGGEVILPFTAPHIFMASDRLNPVLTEILTDPNEDNYYEIIEGKTRVFVKSFSGIGGAVGAPPNLIAHYMMNDYLATTVILDETGSHNGVVKDATGTATSAFHSVTGKINFAQDFDGTDDYIEITDHADFTPILTPFSISAWVYMHDATNFTIVSKGVYNTDGEWRIYLAASDKLYVEFYDESVAACFIGKLYDSALSNNTWYHIVATYDGGILSAGIKIYIDRVQVVAADEESNAASFEGVEAQGHAIWIANYGGAIFGDGLIDNVTFFSQELDQFDVDFLYNMGGGTERWGEKLGTERTTRTMRTGNL